MGTDPCHACVAQIPRPGDQPCPEALHPRLGEADGPGPPRAARGPRHARGRRRHRPLRLSPRQHGADHDFLGWPSRPRLPGWRDGAVPRRPHRWPGRPCPGQPPLARHRRRGGLCPVCQRQRRADRPRPRRPGRRPDHHRLVRGGAVCQRIARDPRHRARLGGFRDRAIPRLRLRDPHRHHADLTRPLHRRRHDHDRPGRHADDRPRHGCDVRRHDRRERQPQEDRCRHAPAVGCQHLYRHDASDAGDSRAREPERALRLDV